MMIKMSKQNSSPTETHKTMNDIDKTINVNVTENVTFIKIRCDADNLFFTGFY